MDVFTEYFSRVAGYEWWMVIIELLLIGLVVYWAVDFLEGTRGERLFQGVIYILVAGFLVLNFLVEKFEFQRLEYLYKYFLVFVLIIAVAGFQPEIRRALIRLGQPGFLTGSKQQLARTAEAIITAVADLGAVKTGAIIVIEKQVALGEFVETGVRIDARVTPELLKTIFRPGTPLHDMAVIIRGDRLIAARVQLPLAEAGSIDGFELGSRHRAAIGISTGSDASVIVVSEETGIVSIAENGHFTRNVDQNQLRQYLSHSFEQTMPIAERFWPFSKKKKQIGPLDAEKN